MKLSALTKVVEAKLELDRVLKKIEAVELDCFVLTINGGEREDAAMLAVIKPSLLAELKARRSAITRSIEAHGVEVG